MTNILHLFLSTTLIFSNLGLNTQIQGQSPWLQLSLTSAGTVPLRLGGTNVVTDESGAQVEYVEYQPFGSVKQDEGRKNISRKFTGKELDSSTGLYDYSARQYDAKLGRFISADTVDPDWANPQSLNRYSYTLNNPLKYVDPSGNYVESPSDWISASMSFDEFQQNPTILSGLALGWDVFALATPGVVGFGGYAIKGTKMLSKVDDTVDAARTVNKAGKVGKAVAKGEEFVHVAPKAAEKSFLKYGLDPRKTKEGISYLTKEKYIQGKSAAELEKILKVGEGKFSKGAIEVIVKDSKIKPTKAGVTTRPGGVPQWKYKGKPIKDIIIKKLE